VPDIIIVAGPNGAGKTTLANAYLPLERGRFVYLNADEIAREPAFMAVVDARREIAAGRAMLNRMHAAIEQRADVMFETTLASLTYARRVHHWRAVGYLRLETVEASIARVGRRVASGGHDIPEATIRQRFDRSRLYFKQLYKPIVDTWYVWVCGTVSKPRFVCMPSAGGPHETAHRSG
jgi:predicted ABC-type ATPase